MKDHAAAWDEFWQTSANSGAGGGCLPDRNPAIDRVLGNLWREFARSLPKNGSVLDLGTGNGRVLAALVQHRRDLKCTGIDLATRLPAPPRGVKFRPGTRMESLPFPGDRFHAVTSQFGFEYAPPGPTATEIARVLRPGGMVALLMHRDDSPILMHNRARREQIGWAIDEMQLVEIARRSLQLRAGGLAAIPAAVEKVPYEAAKRFGQHSAAWEISEAIRQALFFGQRDHPSNVAALLAQIGAKARNEVERIDALEDACKRASEGELLTGAFSEAGLQELAAVPVQIDAASAPFATFHTLRRPG